jgi:hypothetical protein
MPFPTDLSNVTESCRAVSEVIYGDMEANQLILSLSLSFSVFVRPVNV